MPHRQAVFEPGSEAERTARAARTAAWFAMTAFIVLTNSAYGVYLARDIEPSGPFTLLAVGAWLGLAWQWFQAQCRPYGATFGMDVGVAITTFWFVAFPYYLWRFERWRGLAKFVVLAALNVAGFVIRVLIYFVFRSATHSI